jgi:hypothetical protein
MNTPKGLEKELQMQARRIIISCLLLAVAGFAQDVRYNFAAGQDFSKYKTYKWVQLKDTGWGYGPGWGGGWYGGGGGMTTTTSSTILKGQVDLDMYDPAAKQLVWRGTASKTIDPKAKPEKRQKNLQKGVAKLLKNYPPKQKS